MSRLDEVPWALVSQGAPLNPPLFQRLKTYASVIALDGALEQLRRNGFIPQVWIGDGDSLSDPSYIPQSCQKILLPRDKDESDTEAGLLWALNQGCREVHLFGGSGGRFDHHFSNFQLFSRYLELTQWHTPSEEIHSIRKARAFSAPLGTTVSVVPCGAGPWKIKSSGLKWPLDGFNFSDKMSLSNEILGPEFSLTPIQGVFLVIFPREVGSE